MATTDTRLAQILLRRLDLMGVRYLVLHRSEDVAASLPISDVDVIVEDNPWGILARLIEEDTGLQPIMAWEYDLGAVTTFWSTDNGSDGVQLDLLRDAAGRGKYGFRTGSAFNYADESGQWPPSLDHRAQAIYLASKRLVKGDDLRAKRQVQELSTDGNWTRDAASLLSRRSLSRLQGAMAGRYPGIGGRGWALVRGRLNGRAVTRLTRPTGLVIELPVWAEPLLPELLARFSRFLIRVEGRRDPSPLARAWDQFLIRRPVLVLHCGRGREQNTPGNLTESESFEVVARAIVTSARAATCARVQNRAK